MNECIVNIRTKHFSVSHYQCLGQAVGRYPFKFILPEFVSYLGEGGVLCVGNGRYFCTPVLMNMGNATFEVKYIRLYWNNVDPASQPVAQQYISIWPICRVIWCFWLRDESITSIVTPMQQSEHTVISPNAVSIPGQPRRLWVNIETALGECHVFAQSIQQTQYSDRLYSVWPAS